MARSVTYSVVPRRNPRNPEAEPQFYAVAKSRGYITLNEMSERIEKECTLTKADIYAALVALEGTIITALQNGEIVQMGELGSFRIGLSSNAALEEAKFEPTLIKKGRVNFRAGKGLQTMLTTLQYSKVEKVQLPPAAPPQDPLPLE